MAKKRKKYIADPGDSPAFQQRLFDLPGTDSSKDFYGPIGRTTGAVRDLLAGAEGPAIGTDLEFNPATNRPTILGVSTTRGTAAVPWDEVLAQEVVETAQTRGMTLVGHSVVGADKPVYEAALGIETPLELWDDTMLEFYLCNSDFTKAPGKEADDDDQGAVGLMNLWTMASMYTDFPQWKWCRQKACYGPCPTHDVFGYCAIDSMAGLISHLNLQKDMAKWNVPHKLYRELMELSEIAEQMKAQGVRVDREYVATLEAQFERKKLELFPYDMAGKKQVYRDFNPKSPAQVKEYFKKHGIVLEGTDKDVVYKALEGECRRHKLNLEKGHIILREGGTIPPGVDALYRLYQFKSEGKGLSSWFDERYVDKLGFAHPRFIPTGASTGRWASSGPNFQNIPARGFGELVRRAIIARDPSLELLKADFSQLELRMCLYLAGMDPRDIGADAFKWLVAKSGGKFAKAAELAAASERQIAKSVAHAFDYLEGFKLLYPNDLISARVQKEIEYGALRVYMKKYNPSLDRDWTFRGGIVAFTGANLAERLWGSRTLENRKKALEIQEDLFAASFPALRKWQMKVLAEIEDTRVVKSPVGRFLRLYGTPEDDAKAACAFLGQGVSADHVQGVILRYKREMGRIPLLQVHDELDFEIPRAWSDKQAGEFIHLMGEETDRLPGFVGAFKAKRGTNWFEGDMREI